MSGVHIMMAGATPRPVPSFGAAGSGASESPLSGTFQCPYPTGIAAGHPLFAHIIVTATSGISLTVPTGWTQLLNDSFGAGSGAAYLLWKIADGTETGNLNITVSATGTTRVDGRMYRYASGTSVETATSTVTTDAGSTTMAMKDYTTAHKNTRVLQFIWANANTTIGDSSGESGADYTEVTAEYNPASRTMQLQHASVALPTAITGGSATLGASASIRIAQAVAIVP